MTMTDDALVARAEQLLAEVDHRSVDQARFRGAQYDAGLAWVQFPNGKGGLGLPRSKQTVVNRVLRTAGVPYFDLVVNPLGIGMAAPTILAFADEATQERHLRPIFTGQEIWCQLFSEPSHGSDVAGIATRAVRDGDEWVVNGQKVWTTLAHEASYGLLLARTDPDLPKHAGLSYFLLDMAAPGVEVRPLFQLTGEAEFNEVYLTDVRVPADAMLGTEGEGWKVATTTLMNERVALGGGGSGKGGGPIDDLLAVWRRRQDGAHATVADRDRVVRLWGRAQVLRMMNRRARALALSGAPGPDGSLGKLASAELNQDIYAAALDLLGPEGTLHRPGYPMVRATQVSVNETVSAEFLRARANTIEGGTSEILRNIIGERVLGLPGDVRADKGIPWKDIPR